MKSFHPIHTEGNYHLTIKHSLGCVSSAQNVVKIHSLFTNMQNSKFPCAKKEVEMTLLGSLTLFSLPYTCRGHSCIPSGKHSYLWVAGLYASFILL